MAGKVHTFPLAPMSGLILALTAIMFTLPVAFVLMARDTSQGAEVLVYTSWGLVALYIAVFLIFRPLRYEVDSDYVTLVWPIRRRRIPKKSITRARRMTAKEFRAEFGWGARVGVGGLFGAFGLLRTTKGGTMDLYISRHDWMVVVERSTDRTLLVTPDDPEAFIKLLG